ncbi:MAG: hypothetical protein ACYCZA_02870 [Thiobacillus sp.]
MMKRSLMLLALILTACDPTPPPQPETVRNPNPVFETQIQAMKKANAVEGQVNDAAEAQRKQLDEATQ